MTMNKKQSRSSKMSGPIRGFHKKNLESVGSQDIKIVEQGLQDAPVLDSNTQFAKGQLKSLGYGQNSSQNIYSPTQYSKNQTQFTNRKKSGGSNLLSGRTSHSPKQRNFKSRPQTAVVSRNTMGQVAQTTNQNLRNFGQHRESDPNLAFKFKSRDRVSDNYGSQTS